MRDLAKRLVVASRAAHDAAGEPHVHEAVAVCEILQKSISKFAGADGFKALMRRAMALARVETPALQSVKLGDNCQMEGLDELATAPGGADAAAVLTAHMLELLVTFIGEPLTLRLVREGWPDAKLDNE